MTVFTDTSHQYALRGLRKPSHLIGRERGEARETEPFHQDIPRGLAAAESGASHLHGGGVLAEIVWLDPDDGQWKPLTCHYCGQTIQHVHRGWYHSPDGSSWTWPKDRDQEMKIIRERLWCAGTEPRATPATPVAPVTCPTARSSRATLQALPDYLAAGRDLTEFHEPMELYLRDRYAALRESGRLFCGENATVLEQHNLERSRAAEHFTNVMRRRTANPPRGFISEYTRLPADRLRELLHQAAQASCNGCCGT